MKKVVSGGPTSAEWPAQGESGLSDTTFFIPLRPSFRSVPWRGVEYRQPGIQWVAPNPPVAPTFCSEPSASTKRFNWPPEKVAPLGVSARITIDVIVGLEDPSENIREGISVIATEPHPPHDSAELTSNKVATAVVRSVSPCLHQAWSVHRRSRPA